MYAFNINGDHFKICLMVIRLTFVIFQMMSFVYTKAGRSNNHFAPCHIRLITLPHFPHL